MDDKLHTIGMTDLLDEVSRDLDDFRKKHASDYSVKNITLWWELERERLLVRHKDARVTRRSLPGRRVWIFIGSCVVMFAAGATTTLLL